MLLALLATIATSLTIAMFCSRQAMLGFACGIFWGLAGAQSYTLVTGTWGDIYFLFAFASLLGMLVLTVFGAFGLREKRDTIADEEMEKGEGELMEGDKGTDIFSGQENDFDVAAKSGRRTRRSQERTRKKGEFDF